MHNNSLAPRPVSQRPLPFRRRQDLVTREAVYCGQGCHVIKDPVSLEYYRLDELQWNVLRRLDGKRSAAELRREIASENPAFEMENGQLLELITSLHRRRLVLADVPGQADVLLEDYQRDVWRSRLLALRTVFYIRLPGVNPEPLLGLVHRLAGWMFAPVAVVLCSLFAVAVGIHALATFDEIERALPRFEQFFGWPNVLLLWLTMGLAKVLHEIGHGLACRRSGGECHSIGAAFLMFSPCLYCDVSDAWLLPERRKRITVSLAGIYVETLISAIALTLWHLLPDGLPRNLCFNVFLVTSITTIAFNANPLLRYDGYYILSDLLEMPNLRQKASRVTGAFAARVFLGIPSRPPDMSRGRLVLTGLYGVASMLYGWFVVGAILLMLHDRLKPYGLEEYGTAIGFVLLGAAVAGLVWRVGRCLATAEKQQMNLRRPVLTGLALAALSWGLLRVPVPYSVYAQVLIEPAEVVQVHNRTAGRLERVFVRPGESVQQGQLLATLANPKKQEQYIELQTALEHQRIEVALHRGLNDSREEALARTRLAALREQLADFQRQLQEMRITAPRAGVVVQAAGRPARVEGRDSESLNGWSGHPLERANAGAWLPAGTHLLSTSSSPGWEAVMLVRQRDREFLSAGAVVEVRLEGSAGQTFEARISEVGDQELHQVSPAATIAFGGELPAVEARHDQARLVDPVYQARLVFPDVRSVLPSGARGLARLRIRDETVGTRLWNACRQLARFRL